MAAVDYQSEKGKYFTSYLQRLLVIQCIFIKNIKMFFSISICRCLVKISMYKLPALCSLFLDNAKRFLAEFYVDGANGKEFKYGEQLVCDRST